MAASLFKWFFALAALIPAGSRELAFGAGKGEGIANTEAVHPLRAKGEAAHPLYISVTEIDHNAKDKTLEVSCKMFTNDFEATLEKSVHAKVDLSDPKDKKAADKLIEEYVEHHLQLKVDGKAVSLQFVGSEKEADGTWSYFVVNNIPAVKRIDVANSLLYDNFPTETNIMHVSVGGEKKSSRLNYPDVNAVFEF